MSGSVGFGVGARMGTNKKFQMMLMKLIDSGYIGTNTDFLEIFASYWETCFIGVGSASVKG